MPTYKLRCRDCKKEFELFILHTLSDKDKVCPYCKSRKVEQIYENIYGLGARSCSYSSDYFG